MVASLIFCIFYCHFYSILISSRTWLLIIILQTSAHAIKFLEFIFICYQVILLKGLLEFFFFSLHVILKALYLRSQNNK
jgi:hypothetical protein